MSSGLHELIAWPVDMIQRGGKPAAVIAIVLGLILIPCGLYLTFGFLGPGYYWPIMLSVSIFGLGLAGAGLASLFGAQAKLAEFDVDAEPTPRANVALESAKIPFWVCGQCKIVREGVSMTARCEQCASVVDYLAVESEPDRKLAAGLLS